tara:strand:+ start:402 stop:569 length:168 start_codon:yes stop_codon:yes gene_type:complete
MNIYEFTLYAFIAYCLGAYTGYSAEFNTSQKQALKLQIERTQLEVKILKKECNDE